MQLPLPHRTKSPLAVFREEVGKLTKNEFDNEDFILISISDEKSPCIELMQSGDDICLVDNVNKQDTDN